MRYLFENYALDVDRRELRRDADIMSLTPQVFDLLLYLIHHRNRVVSREDLIASIWGGRIVSESALTTRINAVRSAVGDSGRAQRLIKTLPRKGVRFVGEVREEPRPSAATSADASAAARRALTLPDKPSIAVLPFAMTDLSGQVVQDYVSDGFTEDVIIELSRFSELFVIARNSSFQYRGKPADARQIGRELGVRYLLEGSVRHSGGRVRVAAQLIDAQSGAHRWADRYDRDIADIFAVQDEVARTIATILAAHVNKAEAERTLLKPPASWQAYDFYMRGADTLASYWSSVDVQELYEVRRLLERSLAIDPNYARPHAVLSTTYLIAWLNPLDGDHLNAAAIDRSHHLARKAVQLDPNLPQAHASLGAVLATMHQHDAAIAAFERAIALNPNFTDWRFALALVYGGQAARALDVLKAHMRLDPFYVPLAPHWLGRAYFMLKRYDEALNAFRECATRAPNYRAVHLWLAATHARLGRCDDAAAEAAEVLRLDPGFTISGSAKRMLTFKNPSDAEDAFSALRSAGLPE